jgi:gamma-glutamylcyclotransferase (GGCT)/AIG2-like uncharacterized protein YtfP
MTPEQSSKLFVYGILKRGFGADLTYQPGGKFLGRASLIGAQLYHIGSGVGLRFVNDNRVRAWGEVFDIKTEGLWHHLDRMESNGLSYTRKIVNVDLKSAYSVDAEQTVRAWVYEHTYPGRNYTDAVEGNEWRGYKGYEQY